MKQLITGLAISLAVPLYLKCVNPHLLGDGG
jgi:hypothetical protein